MDAKTTAQAVALIETGFQLMVANRALPQAERYGDTFTALQKQAAKVRRFERKHDVVLPAWGQFTALEQVAPAVTARVAK
ncbi:hypothetical protein SEA_GHOBES_42 [Gordonia phage Ghobes]|uniref:Uncharacterized protein n=1 Tax=Gordonia phage Ghobes TaxID=1887647 RepID=A0A1B3B065_9CAUD|nr:hypothetical protein KCH37_gp42 [Gordonia phage Ghobes]AOE44393.1 hypothetical protein SEA_GHOBES_42 [Gordonia phage Ghobes]